MRHDAHAVCSDLSCDADDAATAAVYDAIEILLDARDIIARGANADDVRAFNILGSAAGHLGAFDGQDDEPCADCGGTHPNAPADETDAAAIVALVTALSDLREAATDAYKAGRIAAEPFVAAGNVLAAVRSTR